MPASRLTDNHTCPAVTGIIPHVGGPIVAPGAPTVLIGMLPAARVTDQAVCVGPPDMIVKGAFTTLITLLPAARIGDQTAHGGVIVMGWPTVLIGDAAPGSPLALAGEAAAATAAADMCAKQDADFQKEQAELKAENARRKKAGEPPLEDPQETYAREHPDG